MADLGAIGKGLHRPKRMWVDWIGQKSLRKIVGSEEMILGGRDTTDGKSAPPCFKQERYGVAKGMLWPVQAGAQTLTVWVKHNGHSPAPRIIVKANPDIGINADTAVAAASGTAWQALSVTLSPNGVGVLEVWREVRSTDQAAWAKWDDISILQ